MTLKEFIEQECDIVLAEVSALVCMTRDDILGQGKTGDILRARKEAMRRLLARGFNCKQIAWGLGRDKTAVYRWAGGREYLDRQRVRSRKYYEKKKPVILAKARERYLAYKEGEARA